MSPAKESTPELLERLRAASEGAEAAPSDTELREEFVTAIEAVYAQLKELVEEKTDQGEATWHRGTQKLDEERLGIYDVPTLDLVLHGHRVRFRPQGRIIVGATGRLDMLCGVRERMLVRDQGESGGAWSWVWLEQGDWRSLPLSSESLWRMLGEVIA